MDMHLRRVTLLFVLASGFLTGCLFSPDKKPPLPDDPVDYLDPITPGRSLLNMIAAYQGRDSVGTENVYDPAYEGTSTDLVSPTPAVYNLTRFDEKHHVAALRLNPNISSINVNLGPESTWRRLSPEAGDPQEWAVIQIDQANIQIQDVNTGTLYRSQNNKMLYTFKPTARAPGDSLWHIIRWTEVRN